MPHDYVETGERVVMTVTRASGTEECTEITGSPAAVSLTNEELVARIEEVIKLCMMALHPKAR